MFHIQACKNEQVRLVTASKVSRSDKWWCDAPGSMFFHVHCG